MGFDVQVKYWIGIYFDNKGLETTWPFFDPFLLFRMSPKSFTFGHEKVHFKAEKATYLNAFYVKLASWRSPTPEDRRAEGPENPPGDRA